MLGPTGEGAGDATNMETDQEEKPSAEIAEAEKKRRSKMAAERRVKVMAQMKTQMNKFITDNATLFEETNTDVSHFYGSFATA